MTIKALYPTVRPTLNLDFAKTKALDPRVTFTRASTATFVGANGLIQTAASGAARFDHNPATGESLGLLVEEARTNNATYSEQFDNAAWIKAGGGVTITANSIAAPDGTITADTYAGDGTSAMRYLVNTSDSSTGPKTISVFAKANTNNFLQLFFSGGVSSWANFNVSTGVVGSIGTLCTASMQLLPGGWYRCILYTTDTTAVAPCLNLVTSSSSSRAESNTLSTSVYLWGFQAEAGAFPTSYIPTVASTVTRAADVASMTGTNFSSWYRQDEGTAYIKTVNRSINSPAAPLVFSVGAGGFPFNELLEWDGTGSTNAILLRVFTTAGVQSANITGTVNSANNVNIAAGAFKLNNFAVSLNGNTPLVDNSGDLSAVDTLHIGKNWSTSRYSGTIARLAYYPVRLPDAQLQALTAT